MPSQPFRPCDAEEPRRARRRLRFVTAQNASKVLRHDRYWTAAFLTLYLDECRFLRIRDPASARALAIHGPALVERIAHIGQIAESRRRELFRSPDEQYSAAVSSLALLAECERLCGEVSAARRTLHQALELAAQARRISLVAGAELKRTRALLEIESGEEPAALDRLGRLCAETRRVLEGVALVSDDVALRHAENLLLIGAARWWRRGGLAGADPQGPLVEGEPGRAADPAPLDDLALLAECAAYARPRQRAGEPIFDTALDLLDQRLDGPRAAPDVLEATGRWLRRARRQPFKRGERVRRSRLVWVEGRVLSLLGIARLAERRLLRVWQGFAEADGEDGEDALRLALVTLDLVLLDIGQDDRSAASQRLCEARERLQGFIDHEELGELLQQARRASYDSLQVFRRRLARRLERTPPAALIPRPRSSSMGKWSAPSLGGVA